MERHRDTVMASVPMTDLASGTPQQLVTWLYQHRFLSQPTAANGTKTAGAGQEAAKNELTKFVQEMVRAASALSISELNSDALPLPQVTSQPLAVSMKPSFPLIDPVVVTCLQPRGKFRMEMRSDGITFTSVSAGAESAQQPKFHVPTRRGVSNVVFFPKPTDCRRGSMTSSQMSKITDQFLLVIKESCFQSGSVPDDEVDDNGKLASKAPAPVLFKGKRINYVCGSLPIEAPTRIQPPSSAHKSALALPTSAQLTDQYSSIFCESLGVSEKRIVRIHNPMFLEEHNRKSAAGAVDIVKRMPLKMEFKSHQESNTSSTTAGMPYVACYSGVNDGVLFPTKAGLLFYKPVQFIPRSQLTSIACGRGGGTGGGSTSTRYVDLRLTVEVPNKGDDNEEEVLFTNINRAEVAVLNDYIHNVLIPAKQMDADNDSSSESDDDIASDVAVACHASNRSHDLVVSSGVGEKKICSDDVRVASDQDENSQGRKIESVVSWGLASSQSVTIDVDDEHCEVTMDPEVEAGQALSCRAANVTSLARREHVRTHLQCSSQHPDTPTTRRRSERQASLEAQVIIKNVMTAMCHGDAAVGVLTATTVDSDREGDDSDDEDYRLGPLPAYDENGSETGDSEEEDGEDSFVEEVRPDSDEDSCPTDESEVVGVTNERSVADETESEAEDDRKSSSRHPAKPGKETARRAGGDTIEIQDDESDTSLVDVLTCPSDELPKTRGRPSNSSKAASETKSKSKKDIRRSCSGRSVDGSPPKKART
jgi:Histone chaperone Rttp106-like